MILDVTFQDLSGLRTRDRNELKTLAPTVYELLWRLPTRHQDRRRTTRLREARYDEEVMLRLEVVKRFRIRTKRQHRVLWKVTLSDGVDKTDVMFFNPSVNRVLREGAHVLLWGKVGYNARNGGIEIRNPNFDLVDDGTLPPFAAVYRGGAGLDQRRVRTIMERMIDRALPKLEDFVPASIREERNLPPLPIAMRTLHSPGKNVTGRDLEIAKRSLAYTEAFLLAAGMRVRRQIRERETQCEPIEISDDEHHAIVEALGFRPTPDQRKAIDAIRADLAKPTPMKRLLQGDVGSGKTAVATYAMIACALRGQQSAMLAPTEILARQHNATVRRVANRMEVDSWVLLGSTKTAERRLVLNAFENDYGRILIGTHAILERAVKFSNLRLVVIDEQHKFGVVQRQRLIAKALAPHMLTTTATPIPRTLTLAMHGDLDTSIIRTKPPGRGATATRLVHANDWHRVVELCHRRIRRGEQVYIVCPVVGEDTESEGTSVEEVAREIERLPLAAHGVVRLHGNLTPAQKETAMKRFELGECRVMVCSTVVEVGVDVPEATVMVIRDAHRFGLTQLHQLRGRVGRGSRTGVCVLLSEPVGSNALPRLKTLCATDDGFVVAEADLALRGSGEWFAERQHGSPRVRVLDLDTHARMVQEAFEDVDELIAAREFNSEEMVRYVRAHFGNDFQFTGVDGA